MLGWKLGRLYRYDSFVKFVKYDKWFVKLLTVRLISQKLLLYSMEPIPKKPLTLQVLVAFSLMWYFGKVAFLPIFRTRSGMTVFLLNIYFSKYL